MFGLCFCVCHWITAKVISRFHWVLWSCDMIGPTDGKNQLFFGCDWFPGISYFFRLWLVPGYGFRITFPLPSALQNTRFVNVSLYIAHRRKKRSNALNLGRLISISHTITEIFTKLGEMTGADKGINESTTFWQWSGRYPDFKIWSIWKSGIESLITFGWGQARRQR